jgi:protein-S-isoprenylcysteine O-methyltransferase Ste14
MPAGMNAEVKIARGARSDARPASAVSHGVGVAGLAGLFGWVVIARMFDFSGPNAALCAVVACGAPMLLWSLIVDKVHRNRSTGIDWDSPPRPLARTLDISLTKITGLWATWGTIAAAYCLARWYWDGTYLFAMKVLGYAALPLLALSIPYVLWLDRRLREPRDGAWHLGRLILGAGEGEVDRDVLHDHFRSWTIKAFFSAFMIAIVPGNWFNTVTPPLEAILHNPTSLALWLIGVMFMIDVTFATVGYIMTMKPLDAHIRSGNPYVAGWVSALICYPPFILMNPGGPLNYRDGTSGEHGWTFWLDGSPLLILVGPILVLLAAFYAWATVAFGLRFSNLTHRGILTHGPYAWTKHPAYVSKNLFWWLAVMPFFATTGSLVDAVRNSAILAIVAGVYYWRARTEEKHLMADPAYRDYAAWMERNGPIPRLLRKLKGGPRPKVLPAE